MSLLFHQRGLGVLALLGIIDLLLESWIPKLLSAYLLATHLGKRDINARAHPSIVRL